MRIFVAAVLLLASVTFALAQTPQTVRLCDGGQSGCPLVSATNPLPVAATVTPSGTQDVNIDQIAGEATAADAGVTTAGTLRVVQSNDGPAVPVAGSMTVAGCTVGTSSAGCIAALAVTRWVQLQNTHATNSIACQWGAGPAGLNSNNSFMLAAGQSASWGPATGGVPTNALQCIASGADTPLYAEYR